MSSTKRSKGNGGKRLTHSERLEIIETFEVHNPPSNSKVARQFGVGEKTIRDIRKKKDVIKERVAKLGEAERQKRKRFSEGQYPEVEKRVLQWLTATRKAGVAVPPSMLQRKALSIAHALGISPEAFKASKGWLANFRKRNGVNCALLHGEGGEVDKDTSQTSLNRPIKNNSM